MSNYRKTMTEALQEMVSLDERMRMPRQLIDTNKEVMIVKKNKVIVIDKKDQDKYMKQGWELAEEVGLNEGTIDKVKEIASKKQAMKIDGVMVDSFTASAISQIYDKVNDANKKKMDKLPITKLASLAMKMMQKNEFVPEGKMQDVWQKKNAKSLSVGSFELIRGKSGVHTIKQSGKVIGDFSYDDDADNFVANMKGMKGQWTGNDIDSLFTHLQKVHKEEVELDEAKIAKKVPAKDGGHFVVLHRDTSGMRGTQDKFHMRHLKNGKVKDYGTHSSLDGALKFAKNRGIIEEVDLDEGKQKPYVSSDSAGKHVIGASGKIVKSFKDMDSANAYLKKNYNELMKEEVELDEKVKEYKGIAYFKDRKDAEAHMKKYAPKGRIVEYERGYAVQVRIMGPYLNKAGKTEEVDLDEASARADARRSMRADPDMRQKFSKDVSATDDDVKGASKNIMMQMRKAQSLNGRFDVEFADGKKVKIPAKMAIAVQQKYNSMKRPAEKEKFQAKVGKSYRDMLSALKEAVSPAQQAAIAISKKERGEKPKKESVLDRIDKKIKEKNDG